MRGPFQGILQILSFNRTFYAVTLAACLAGLVAAEFTQGLLRLAILLPVIAALLWTASSLVVSHYVYDRSPLYRLEWLKLTPAKWVNIHAGLDETTLLLKERYRQSAATVWDIFDPQQMTEPSMKVAREVSGSAPAAPVSWRQLPALNGSFDAVFLIFVAHELRTGNARREFLREVKRILAPGGSAVVVEHVRDVANALAFGPGVLHFHSRQTWIDDFRAANLLLREEQRITPFVLVFQLVA